MINWHHIFGLILEDLFTGTGYDVEVEKNLSRKIQLLDIVIIRRDADSRLPSPLPDGLDNPGMYNLLTYKSFREPLNDWTMDELLGHYVAYRKSLAAPGGQQMPAKQDFRLYAVAVRFPRKLARRVCLKEISAGVYEVLWGVRKIRLIIPGRVPDTEANAMWAMCSADDRRILEGSERYQWRDPDKRKVVTGNLYQKYREEGIDMAFTKEDFLNIWLQSLPLEQRLQGVPPEEIAKTLPTEARLQGLPPEARLQGLPPGEIAQVLPTEARLQGLPPEVVQAWLTRQQLKKGH
jgi:hypothetical protein